MATVYGLYNYTKRERYYGTTTRAMVERLREQKSGQTQAISHWNWRRDRITARVIATRLTLNRAIAKAHELELRTPPPGWTIIQTGGM